MLSCTVIPSMTLPLPPSTTTPAPKVTSPSTSSRRQEISDGAPAGKNRSKRGSSLYASSSVTTGGGPSKAGSSRPSSARS
jgi:hypothetical protein